MATSVFISSDLSEHMYYPSSPTEAIVSSTSDMIFPENVPYLAIVIQPSDKFRFRYKSEVGSHGGITGECYSRVKKTFPTVKLHNHNSSKKVFINASLYTACNNPRPHVLDLVGKACQNGVCYQKLDSTFCAKFQGLSILNRKKDEVLEILRDRKKQECNVQSLTKNLEDIIQDEAKHLDLNAVRLCFEAVFEDKAPVPGCCKILSNTIFNLKSTVTGDLKICRLSLCTGRCSGGEEVILLCNKIKKDEIEIRFFEKDDYGNTLWSTDAHFNVVDVHHQVAIPFKTPKYEGSNCLKEDKRVGVWIQLVRKSDQKHGEPIQFTYVCDRNENSKKRKSSVSVTNHATSEPLTNVFTLPSNMELNLEELYPGLLARSRFDDVEELDINPSYNANLKNDTFFGATQFVNKDAVEFKQEDTRQNSFLPPTVEIDVNCQEYHTKAHAIHASKNEQLTKLQSGSIGALMNKFESMNIQDSNGNSFLHLAIIEKEQDLKIISGILKRSPEELVNQKNINKETPLHLATCKNQVQILKLLLHHGGNPQLINEEGNDCLHLASMYSFSECLQELLSDNEEKKYKPDVNSLNFDGLTPLHLSVINNSKECMELLLNAKADVNIGEKKSGRSIFHLAVELRSSLIDTILLQPDINIEMKDYKGYTALQTACEENGISYEDLPSEIKSDKQQISSFLMKLFEEDEDNKSESNFHSEAESLSDSDEDNQQDFQSKVEDFLNSTSNWKKLGTLADVSETNLKFLADIDNNPAKLLIERIKKTNKLGDTNKDLLRILQMAGLSDAMKRF